MNPVILFFFTLLSVMYLYGYYTYYFKERKRLPKCNVIYVLDDGIKDDHRPDFNEARRKSTRNISEKNKVRENIKEKILQLIGDNDDDDNTYESVIESAKNKGISDLIINGIIHDETLKIRGNM